MVNIRNSGRFSVGIESIDDAHGTLFDLIEKLSQIIKNSEVQDEGETLKSARYVINRLLDYTVSHFAEEEYLMELFKAPGRFAHKKSHRSLERSLIELYKRFNNYGLIVLPELVELLNAWWAHHILTMDKKDLEGISEHDLPDGQHVFSGKHELTKKDVG